MNVLRFAWDLEIVALAGRGVSRFEEFRQQLGISRKVLSERLRWLTAAEILERREYQAGPRRFEYVLTDKGRALLPIHAAVVEWRARWEC